MNRPDADVILAVIQDPLNPGRIRPDERRRVKVQATVRCNGRRGHVLAYLARTKDGLMAAGAVVDTIGSRAYAWHARWIDPRPSRHEPPAFLFVRCACDTHEPRRVDLDWLVDQHGTVWAKDLPAWHYDNDSVFGPYGDDDVDVYESSNGDDSQ